MSSGIDTIDERIIYRLTEEARHTSAPDIAEEVDVSPPTVRNRIRRLEDRGIIEGYHAHVDYEALDGRLTNLFFCTTRATDRSRFARRVLDIAGVVGVREVMTGQEDLQVTVVGEDTNDLRRIARELSALGVDIEDEDLVHREHFQPYAAFGPESALEVSPIREVADLSGDTNVVEVSVSADAPIVGKTLAEATDEGFLEADSLVVSINRDEEERAITPNGDTVVRAGDLVTLFSRSDFSEETLRPFTAA